MTQHVWQSVHFEEAKHDSLHNALCVRVTRVFVEKAHRIRITNMYICKINLNSLKGKFVLRLKNNSNYLPFQEHLC